MGEVLWKYLPPPCLEEKGRGVLAINRTMVWDDDGARWVSNGKGFHGNVMKERTHFAQKNLLMKFPLSKNPDEVEYIDKTQINQSLNNKAEIPRQSPPELASFDCTAKKSHPKLTKKSYLTKYSIQAAYPSSESSGLTRSRSMAIWSTSEFKPCENVDKDCKLRVTDLSLGKHVDEKLVFFHVEFDVNEFGSSSRWDFRPELALPVDAFESEDVVKVVEFISKKQRKTC